MTDPLDAAVAAARTAGAILMDHLHRPLHIQEKGKRADLVTVADRASEEAVVRELRSAFPHAALLGEEGGARAGTSGERWIIDPLDGTTNYAHGYPLFCVSIAYERDGVVEAGVTYAPLLGECFTAARGAGAHLNGSPVAVSSIGTIGAAMVCTGFKPYDFETNAAYFALASHRAQAVRRDGSAALDLAYTAMGRFDAFWEFDLAPWDLAAGTLLVREAGGMVTDTAGAAFTLTSRSVLASNGIVHAPVQALFDPRDVTL